MGILVGNDYRELSVYVSFGLENYVRGKYGQSGEAVYGFFVQLSLELLCNEACYHCWKRFKVISLNVSLGLENCVVG